MRLFLQTVDHGPVPPALLNLSDGGHVEALGLLALLKKRLRKIVVVDGTVSVLSELVQSLDLARKKLRCSFSAMDGRDIVEDLRCKLEEMPDNNKPRFYKFRVEYFGRKANGLSDEKIGDGEVMLILPRHPDEGKSSQSTHLSVECNPCMSVFLSNHERSMGRGWGTASNLFKVI